MNVFHTVLGIHQRLYETSDGRIGHRLLGVPTLLLRTIGRRTGAPRTNALVYAEDGDRYLVVPSNGGAATAPGWYFNLGDKPDVEVQIGRKRSPVHAAIVNPSDPDFDRVWRIVNDNNGDRYNAYQRNTERPIPVVALEPSPASTA